MYPFGEATRQLLFYALPGALLVLALAVPWVERRRAQRPGLARAHLVGLGLVTLLGFGLYTNQNWAAGRYFNPYEFFHYYVGSKYAAELGYTRLYDAAALVDREDGRAPLSRDVTNLGAGSADPEYKRLTSVWAEAAAIRAPFTPERWQAFRQDVAFFRDELPPAVWDRLLHDKGYNATPFWTIYGGSLASLVPARHGPGLVALVALDPLLLLLGFACVAWAFGVRAMLFAAALYLTHYCTSHAHFRAAFLRTDWLVALVASLCCLRKRRPFLAGALLASSALVRVFPVLFALGPLAVLAREVLLRRRGRAGVETPPLPPLARTPAARFVAGAALVGTLLLGLTLLQGGLEPWRAFLAKIVEHDQRPASDTVGFRQLFLWTLDFGLDQGHEIRARFEAHQLQWWLLQALFALGLAFLAARRPLEEALALGFALVWFLANPAYYYYAFLVVPLLHFAGRAERGPRAAGLALVFATSLGARASHGGLRFEGHFAFKLSCVMGALALALCAVAWLESRRPAEADGSRDA